MRFSREQGKRYSGSDAVRAVVSLVLPVVLAGAWFAVSDGQPFLSAVDRTGGPGPTNQDAIPDPLPGASGDTGYTIAPVPGVPGAGNAPRATADSGQFPTTARSTASGDKGRWVHTSGNAARDSVTPKEEDDLALPEWARIFGPDGNAIDRVNEYGHFASNQTPDYFDLYAAFEAGYVEEVISNGVATDMSALLIARDVADEVLYNGAVSPAHDLGNFFYMLSLSTAGNIRFHFGVERLRSDFPTFIEFELNQVEVRVGSGTPWWSIQGIRQDGDILVRVNLISGNVSSIELATWTNGTYQIFDSDTQGLNQGCREHFSYKYCIGAPPIDRSEQSIEVWNDEFIELEPTLANSFVEIAIDMTRLIGSGAEFSSVYVRTPEDVLFSGFSSLGTKAGLRFGAL